MRTAAALALVFFFFSPVDGRADAFTIDDGSFSISWARGSFRSYGFALSGDDLFLRGAEPDGPSQNDYFPACHEFLPCHAGDATVPGGDVHVSAIGSAMVDDAAYDLTRYDGLLTFVSQAVSIPDTDRDAFTVQAPFRTTGDLDIQVYDSTASPVPWVPLLRTTLSGRGLATLHFDRAPQGEGYELRSVQYDFAAPVPEPATIVLFGSGLAVMAGARLRKRRP